MLDTLTFIHRFRHVTAKHVQLCHGHAIITPTNKQLSLLRARGYIARHYDLDARARNRAASYYLTSEGLQLLQTSYPTNQYRRIRSIQSDAAMGLRQRQRYHTLADTYAHFKRHYPGHFSFYSAHDLSKVSDMPDEVPDGYVRLKLPRAKPQQYFIEIYGWGRSTQLQRRRLASYFAYAESIHTQSQGGQPKPGLFIITPSHASQLRLHVVLAEMLGQSFADAFPIHTTTAAKLNTDLKTIWRPL